MERRLLRTIVIVVAVVLSTIVLPAFGRSESPTVVVEGGDGRIVEIALRNTSRFSLSYRHSVYERPAIETFEIDDRGGFALVQVESRDERTLDYYGVEGTRSTESGWRRLSLDEPPSFTRLPVIATAKGGRTLVVGDRRVPLYGGRDAAHVTICLGPTRGCS